MILTYLCFAPSSVSPRMAADFIESHDLGFTPETIRADQFRESAGVSFSREAIERLRRLERVSSVHVEGPAGSFGLTAVAGWPTQLVVVKAANGPPEALVESASALPGFVAALVGDAEDVFWQSADQVNTYQIHGRDWQHLSMIRDDVVRPKQDRCVGQSRPPGSGTRHVALGSVEDVVWTWIVCSH